MASSDEEGEIVPDLITDYWFTDQNDETISFSILPIHWTEDEIPEDPTLNVFLHGVVDSGLQKICKKAIGWAFELSLAKPEIYVLSKNKTWIKLQKPRKSFEETIRSIMITVHCLHVVKKNPVVTKDLLWNSLRRAFRSEMVEPSEKDLLEHVPLIKKAASVDKDIEQSEYLATFIHNIEVSGKREAIREVNIEDNRTPCKSKFIVDAYSDDDDDDGENRGLFDSVCAYCDNGGEVLSCEGVCIRSFHPTVDAGVDTSCESLGFTNAAQYEAIRTFLCHNCQYEQHQCFICGMLGSSNKSTGAEVLPCVSATCGHFYHPKCVAKRLYPSDENQSEELEVQIAAGEPFTCPAHICSVCKQGENKEVTDLQFAVCRRCPKAYHRKCLPRDHKIIPELGTPKRDHLLFPCVEGGTNQHVSGLLASKEKVITEKRSKVFGNLSKNNLLRSSASNKEMLQKLAEKRRGNVKSSSARSSMDNNLSVSERVCNSSSMDKSKSSRSMQSSSLLHTKSHPLKSKKQCPTMKRDDRFLAKPVMRTETGTESDTDMKKRILKLMKDSTSSFNAEEFKEQQRRECNHTLYSSRTQIVKTITTGKVEASLKAVRAAVAKLEVGCSVEEAKVVCEPEVLKQLIRWKRLHESSLKVCHVVPRAELPYSREAMWSLAFCASENAFLYSIMNALKSVRKEEDISILVEPLNENLRQLGVYLAPFLHGKRYTSYGRHFTKVEKFKEIVNRLHWYVKDGDMIVDFCCGMNDFSCLMKEKLDKVGKRCSFKNYDLFPPSKDFSFEKRDWFTVGVGELPSGSSLIMGLNPPFGVQACLANKFIDWALKFKPKLLILIVPKDTERLDKKTLAYDLIWEDDQILSGKSFYLPGSVDINGEQLEDWNINPPPLYLWSHPDWTAQHKIVALKQGHLIREQEENQSGDKIDVSDDLMEETHDRYNDFSTIISGSEDDSKILDNVPDEEPAKDNSMNGTEDMEIETGNSPNKMEIDNDLSALETSQATSTDTQSIIEAKTSGNLTPPSDKNVRSEDGPQGFQFVQPTNYCGHNQAHGSEYYGYHTNIPLYPQMNQTAYTSATNAWAYGASYGQSAYPSQTYSQPPLATTYDPSAYSSEPDIFPPGTSATYDSSAYSSEPHMFPPWYGPTYGPSAYGPDVLPPGTGTPGAAYQQYMVRGGHGTGFHL